MGTAEQRETLQRLLAELNEIRKSIRSGDELLKDYLQPQDLPKEWLTLNVKETLAAHAMVVRSLDHEAHDLQAKINSLPQ